MKNYEAMSDEELNFEVARHSFDAEWLDRHYGKEGMVPDYCNDWEVSGPIIAEKKISVTWCGSYWTAIAPFVASSVNCQDKENPIRPAMIVFLMMKDAEK